MIQDYLVYNPNVDNKKVLRMKIELVSIGSELVCGQVRDINAPLIASKLTELGFNVVNHTIAGDNSDELKFSLQAASERADLIIITGGLGPTNDDITREAVAGFCNVTLVSDEESIKHVEDLIGNIHNQKYVAMCGIKQDTWVMQERNR